MKKVFLIFLLILFSFTYNVDFVDAKKYKKLRINKQLNVKGKIFNKKVRFTLKGALISPQKSPGRRRGSTDTFESSHFISSSFSTLRIPLVVIWMKYTPLGIEDALHEAWCVLSGYQSSSSAADSRPVILYSTILTLPEPSTVKETVE